MQEIAQLLVLLVAFYATFGIMAVGCGTMIAGAEGASAAGNFFFVRPLQWIGQQMLLGCTALLVASWTFMLHRVVDPSILVVERAVVWLLTRERGWMQRR